VTREGQALRFSEKEIRPMGRTAAGVNGIRLQKGDRVAGMEVAAEGGYLLVITELGHGKRTPLADYPTRRRATGGVTTINQKSLGEIGRIAEARVVRDTDDLTIVSNSGVLLRLKVKDIRPAGRSTRGVRLIGLQKDDVVASLGVLPAPAEVVKEAEQSPDGKGSDGQAPEGESKE
jgi:DNA gyrase subunit A